MADNQPPTKRKASKVKMRPAPKSKTKGEQQ